MDWHIIHQEPVTNLDQLESVLVANRQISDPAEFFQPTSPLTLSLADVGLDPAVMAKFIQRLDEALQNHQKVIVFGDYDADGVCATTILWEALHALGIQSLPFLPHREKHGYGLSERAFADLLADGQPDLIVTVDNGIVAHPAILALQQRGIEVLVTDHHQPDPALGMPAPLTLHTTQLCGTTVAWFLARELYAHAKKEWVDQSLDLCAIATIADQVPLLAANRSFAVHGLKALTQTSRLGLQQLIEMAGLTPTAVTAGTIGFGIAPRLNAMGRLGHSLDALRLLCTKQPERAKTLAQQLSVTNVKRQELTSTMMDVARAQAEAQADQHVIVVGHAEFHEGVIGLLAGRLMEETSKPVIAVALGPTLAKASARSVKGVNIVELIRLIRSDLLELGGHPMAAGFSFSTENWSVVQQRLQTVAFEQVTAEVLKPQLVVEAKLPVQLVTTETLSVLKKFEPFGQANPEPIFAFEPLVVETVTTIGTEHQHLKVVLTDEDTLSLTALGWHQGNMATQLAPGTLVEVAARIGSNTWKNRTTVQLTIADIRVKSDK